MHLWYHCLAFNITEALTTECDIRNVFILYTHSHTFPELMLLQQSLLEFFNVLCDMIYPPSKEFTCLMHCLWAGEYLR